VILAAVAAAILVAALPGCQSPIDEERMPTRQTFDFKGTVDPKFAGDWLATPAPTALAMKKDGTVDIVSVASGPRGKVITKLSGSWLVSGSDFLIKYTENGGSTIVLKYAASLSGDTMTLVQAGNHVKKIYHRKPVKGA